MAVGHQYKHCKFSCDSRDRAQAAVSWGVCSPDPKNHGRAGSLGDSGILQRDCLFMEIN